jgi:hypothetical protein
VISGADSLEEKRENRRSRECPPDRSDARTEPEHEQRRIESDAARRKLRQGGSQIMRRM